MTSAGWWEGLHWHRVAPASRLQRHSDLGFRSGSTGCTVSRLLIFGDTALWCTKDKTHFLFKPQSKKLSNQIGDAITAVLWKPPVWKTWQVKYFLINPNHNLTCWAASQRERNENSVVMLQRHTQEHLIGRHTGHCQKSQAFSSNKQTRTNSQCLTCI